MRFGDVARAGALALFGAFWLAAPARADDTYYMSKLETSDLQLLYYDPLDTYLVPYVGRAFENAMAFQEKLYDWKPWDPVTLELRDFADNGNALVRTQPNNELTVDIAPMETTFETFTPGERFFTLMNHELTHVATLDGWNAQDAWWRNVFHGKQVPVTDHPESILYAYLSQPRTNAPRWYLEGSAVFMETWMGGGLGRAQGGYDEMVFRAMVRDNAHFFTPLGLEAEGNSIDFQVGANDYLYGTRFYSYLALTYGPEKVIEWLKRGPDSEGYYASQFQKVFGKPLDDAWNDWIVFEHQWQAKNLSSVQKYPVTQVKRLTPHGLGSVSRSFYDAKTDSLVTGFRDVGQLANIGLISLKDGSIRKLVGLKGPALYRVTSMAYDPDARIAYYTADNNAFRDLLQVDIDTGESKMLLRDARIGDIAFDRVDKSIWGIRHLNGLDTMVRIRAAHDQWNQIITFPYGQEMFDLDVSPDGVYLSASVTEIDGASRIDIYRIEDLLAGKAQAIATLALGQAIPEGGVFSPDGKYLYATAYYTGVSNVYRLNIAANGYDAVSNAVTGFFRPIPMQDGSLIAYEYTGQGFQPVAFDPKPLNDLSNVKFLGTEIADEHPIVKTWAVGSPAKVDLESRVTDRGFYKPDDELGLDSVYPFIAGYKGHVAVGGHMEIEDPMQFDHLIANVMWSPASDLPNGQQFHGDITWQTLFWKFTYWHNKADFYDLFGPTERSRKGDALEAAYSNILLYDPPQQLTFEAAGDLYTGLDTLPGAQNIAGLHDRNIAEGKLGLVYQNADKSLGAVDLEQGYTAGIHALEQYSDNHAFTKIHADASIGWALPWNHASVWFYGAAGIAGGPSNNALDYYYFGAFGNNYVDDREIKRYRDYDAFPGFGIDDISARSFAKLTGEFNLPPIRFDDVGTDSFYLSSIRSAVFGGVLNASPGNEGHQTLEDVGFQLDWNFTVAVRLPMTLSIGDAVGFDGGRSHQNEVMVSLKIL
jgi:hypothetical protein